jgi:hypothetical protein
VSAVTVWTEIGRLRGLAEEIFSLCLPRGVILLAFSRDGVVWTDLQNALMP